MTPRCFALIRIAGTNALHADAGQNEPFLTTREVFTLKSKPGAGFLSAYRSATTPVARDTVVKQADVLPLPNADQLLTSPELAVEWHYSVRDLCRLIDRVSEVPVVSINSGVADATAFRHVAYKGGSDLGAINLTTAVTTTRGTQICVSATLNDPAQPIDEPAFEAAYGGVLRWLGNE